ncbi:MAG: HlyC/CorC family transporter [Planctomycetes bacterium]|nr:HlyC/CorC family transporter [Planctomycetota bacterium]
MTDGWAIIFICLFTGLSLFFSLNGFSLSMFSRIKMQDALKSRNKEALFDRFIAKQESLLLTCALFAVIANVAAVVMLGSLFSPAASIFFFLTAVVIIEIFCVAIPYSWAKYTSDFILSRTCRTLLLFAYIAKPLLYIYRLHDTLAMRLAGVSQTAPDQDERQEELLSVVEQGIIEGVVDKEEMEMIENVLELSDSTADEIMTPRTDLIAINVKESLEGVLETISAAGHSRIPVYEDNIDNIIGLVYAKDLLAEIGKDLSGFKLTDKIRDAYFVPETKPLRDLLHEFQKKKLHIAVVLDEYGGTAGIVTIEDILEELVGEIVDEYEETPQQEFNKIDETTVEIDARMHIDDLNEEFDISLPEEEDYDTAGGFVFSHLGYIPKTGETFEHKGLKFTITEAETRRINRIKIQKLEIKS